MTANATPADPLGQMDLPDEPSPAAAPPATARGGATRAATPAPPAPGRESVADGASRGRRPGRVPTMQDIAIASGVSQSTVSRVLTGAHTVVPINPATRERVLEVARQLRYRPNPLARGLRGARTMLLGVIVREITDPFFASAIDAISVEASSMGYNVVLGSAHSRADEAIALRAVLETRHCDAILFLGDLSDEPRLVDDLRDTNLSLVGCWQGSPLPGISTVNVDNRAGIEALLDHLVGLGHSRIAFIGGFFVGGSPLGDIFERRSAFIEGMTSRGLRVPPEYLQEAHNKHEGGAIAFEALMRRRNPPTAVIASTDVLAIGALHAAHRLGLRVPDDVSIVGFDDLPLAAYTVPALTTIHMPMAEMAAVAVPVAIGGADEREAPEDHVLVPSLVVRGSSGPVPRLAANRG